MHKILIIDADADYCARAKIFLHEASYQVDTCVSFQSAIPFLETGDSQLVLAAITLPDLSGAALFEALSQKYAQPPVLFMVTSQELITFKILLQNIGNQYLLKSDDFSYWLSIIQQSIKYSFLLAENKRIEHLNQQYRFQLGEVSDFPVTELQLLEQYRKLLDHAPISLAILNTQTQILMVNRQFEHLSGYTRAELENIFTLKQVLPGISNLKNWLTPAEAIHAKPLMREFRHKNGDSVMVQFELQELTGESKWLATFLDLSQQQSFRQQLAQKNLQFITLNSLFQAISQMSDNEAILKIALESVKKIIPADVSFIHLWEPGNGLLKMAFQLGSTTDEERQFATVLPLNDNPWWRALKKRGALYVSASQPAPDGHLLAKTGYSCACYLPLFYKKKFLGVLTLGCATPQNFSEEQQHLLELICCQVATAMEHARLIEAQQQKSQEIEEKNQELKSFIYTISHDLKSPLVALYGFSDLLQENYNHLFDETGRDYLKRIMLNAELMHRMIDDLLELSRIGRVLGPRTKFSTLRLILELAAMFEYQLRQKGIKLILPAKMPIIYADRERIATVFQNLLTNAIKFSRTEHAPWIRVDWKEIDEQYRFSMADNGIGIESQYQARVFELFQKFGGQANEGTGIGLTITKKIVEYHGGKIWVESELNVGTTFFFTIPKYSNRQR